MRKEPTMEKVLNNEIIRQINGVFAEMKEPVQILYFGSKDNCDHCLETKQLLEEVAALDEKLALSVYDIQEDHEFAEHFNVFNAPRIVIAARDGPGFPISKIV